MNFIGNDRGAAINFVTGSRRSFLSVNTSDTRMAKRRPLADRRQLSSGLAGCCKAARSGHGLPESEEGAEGTHRPRLFRELVHIIDSIARKLEREERLR